MASVADSPVSSPQHVPRSCVLSSPLCCRCSDAEPRAQRRLPGARQPHVCPQVVARFQCHDDERLTPATDFTSNLKFQFPTASCTRSPPRRPLCARLEAGPVCNVDPSRSCDAPVRGDSGRVLIVRRSLKCLPDPGEEGRGLPGNGAVLSSGGHVLQGWEGFAWFLVLQPRP